VAEVVLIGAVWASLQLAGSEPGGERPMNAADVALPEAVAGFRADAWFLPDEALLGFVEIPEGPFTMGSDPTLDPMAFDIERWSLTQPQGSVNLRGFYIGRYEVTVAQFAAFVHATGYTVVDPTALQAAPDHPVSGVSWTDALAYSRWLDQALRSWPEAPEALSRLLQNGWKVSLPSEAQWEKAARDADGRIYPWGNEPRQDRGVFATRGTAAVGSMDCPECAYGLADMSGNVWEWTRSPYQPYPYDEADDREGLDVEALWVMRGGAFNDGAQNVRAAGRGGADPGARRPFIGFRLVVTR